MTKPSYEELERRIRELDASESQVMEERDAAENALQEAHIALGGDGEWVGKMPPEYPPDSGDLKLDVPELAAQLKGELARVRGLLQRAIGYVEQFACSDPKCRDTGHVGRNQWLAEVRTNFPQSSSLVSQGAESADIGKLDTADKSELLPTQLPKEK